MKRISPFFVLVFSLPILACGLFGSSYSEPTKPIASITIGSDLTAIDLCQAIPQEDIEAVMGRKLAGVPANFYDSGGKSGCWYEAEKDSSGEAHFGYVILTPVGEYENQQL